MLASYLPVLLLQELDVVWFWLVPGSCRTCIIDTFRHSPILSILLEDLDPECLLWMHLGSPANFLLVERFDDENPLFTVSWTHLAKMKPLYIALLWITINAHTHWQYPKHAIQLHKPMSPCTNDHPLIQSWHS
jgi:hypothetical protein